MRQGTHGFFCYGNPEDAIAPYYFWANLPYVTAATRLLEDTGGLSGAQAKIVKLAEEETKSVISTLLKQNLFLTLAKETFPAASVWANALAGISLLPMIESCGGQKMPRSSGILSTAARFDTTYPHARALGPSHSPHGATIF